MRIFNSRWFQRFAKKEGIAARALVEAVLRAEAGQVDADLGGEVIKQRIARPGQGKAKAYRTVILFRRGDKAFIVYGFSKSQRANLNDLELRRFKEEAGYVLGLPDNLLAELLKRGDFVEVEVR